jgi:C-terminal processing protease CtpA/Prc
VLAVFVATTLPSSRHVCAPVETILDIDREFVAGSRIELDSLSQTQVENLVVLAKVWGFLKYHHPRVTSGRVHWDFELFRVLPSILAATDASQRNAAMLRWLKRLGEVPSCVECASPPIDAHLLPRIDWIRDELLLGAEFSRALQHVWKNRPTGEQFWVGQHDIGNPDLTREPVYAEFEHVDTGYRILAAFRLWNIIEYWFPYRDMIDEDWDGVLRELLPAFVAAHEHEDYERALLLLIARVHDTHANVRTAFDSRPPLGRCGLPVGVRFLAGHAVVTSVWRQPKLRVGDVLVALDGRPLDELIEEWRPYYAASNEPTRLHHIAYELSRGECGPVVAVVGREGEEFEFELKRVPFDPYVAGTKHDRRGDTFQLLGDDVAYIKLSTIERDEARGHIEDAAGTRGLVIDIRNYPNADVVRELGQHLVEAPTPFVRFTMPDLANPGAFTWRYSLELTPRAPHYSGKIVILIDEVSMSASEFDAMAFRAAPRSIVIGSTTAGADGDVSDFALPGGEWTKISGIGIFYPDKRPTQRIGIVPDITVTPTREGIRDGRDELLERALREILGSDVPEAKLRELARSQSK